jgi:hypothetical protein
MKIFYNPVSLKIMGASDGENSMQFPYVETDIDYHSTENLGIEMVDGVAKLKVVKGYMDETI